jgi:hypothetical protein
MTTTPQSVAAQIAHLSDLPIAEIKTLWQRLFGRDTPTYNRQFLERRIAYKLQEIEFKKKDPELVARNQRRIASLIENGNHTKRERDYALVSGTLLTREYRGVEHRVTVIAQCQYEFEGRHYPSLSVIAREITGTRWSGPLFFGIKSSCKTSKAGKR